MTPTPTQSGERAEALDAAQWRAFLESVSAEQVVSLSEKFGDALGVVRDAARYRYLRDAPSGSENGEIEIVFWRKSKGHVLSGKPLDRKIDAAIAALDSEESK